MQNITNIKCVLVGDCGVGKTCLLITHTSGVFPAEYIPAAFERYTADVFVDGQAFTLDLWDSFGQEAHDRLRPLAYPQTGVFLLCFSIASPSSFGNVGMMWVPEVTHHAPKVPLILVGTKADLRDDEETKNKLTQEGQALVSFEDGQKLAKDIGAYTYVECSALTQQGVTAVFDEVARCEIDNSKPARKAKMVCVIL